MTPVSEVDQQESGQELGEKIPNKMEKRTIMDVNESMTVSSEEFEEEDEDVPDDSSKQQISQNALRKLQRDMIEALTKQQESSKTTGEISEISERKAELEARDDAMMTSKIIAEDEEHRSFMKNQEVDIDAMYSLADFLFLRKMLSQIRDF